MRETYIIIDLRTGLMTPGQSFNNAKAAEVQLARNEFPCYIDVVEW